MYPFLTMNDHTEIVYSHLLDGYCKVNMKN